MMSRTVTFVDEQFALFRQKGVIDTHHHISATIMFGEPDDDDNAPSWIVTGIEMASDFGGHGWNELPDEHYLYKLIVDLIETHESEAVAELIAAALDDDPDYLRDRRAFGTLNHNQQFGRRA